MISRRFATPALVLGTSLLITALATWAAAATVRGRLEARFDSAVQSTRDRLDSRLDTYVALLRATAAFVAASDHVSAADFHQYADRLRVRERYPGIQGIGLSLRVTAAELRAVERRMSAEGDSAFHVWPDSARAEYHAIVYLEPLDRRNRAAIGYDMFTQPTRREAMERARDDGAPSATGRVQLVQEIDERKQAGFLIYVPLYRGGRVPGDVAARRAALQGFVYAPFRADDLFSGVFGREREPRVDFRIYDGATTDSAALLHDSRTTDAPAGGARRARAGARVLSQTVRIENAGRIWTLVFTSTPALASGTGTTFTLLAAACGTFVSVALFLFALGQARSQERLERAAQEMESLARELQARNVELASANESKSEFLAVMSHEVRTPLNAIIGYAQLLELGIAGSVTPEQSTQLGRIAKSGTHLLALVDEILDLSRIEAGRLAVSCTAASAAAAVDAALALVRPQAAAKGIALEAELDALGHVTYLGDEHRVQQILVNLLTNAVKFTPAAGRIRIEGGYAERTGEDGEPASRGGWAYIAVHDTGPGIAPRLLERIFQPFVQGDSGYTRAHSGTGLGLTISRRLARLMNGDLVVDSVEGEGSCFTLRLPTAPSAVGEESDEMPIATTTATPTGADAREAAQVRGPDGSDLAAVGRTLLDELHTVARDFVGALRADAAAFPHAGRLSDAQLEDHVQTWLVEVAQSLVILHGAGTDPSELMRDGTEIRRLISERHGVQRYRLGWSEEALVREFALLRERIDAVLAARGLPAALMPHARTILAGATRQAEEISLRSFRSASRTSVHA
ncbi:MAG TPA: CHASE domain-containing protein [Gemmatimonadaceae bacterium]|jgi:signal transduction histidine kinase|nr:CHASE domain-containing protein [Gemmatimonadaceae bacterium]